MSLEIMNKINIDFSDNKYTTINAKQYDKKSRFILVTCYNNGKLFYIDKNNNTAYIRYRKSDNFGVFNDCEITDEGSLTDRSGRARSSDSPRGPAPVHARRSHGRSVRGS